MATTTRTSRKGSDSFARLNDLPNLQRKIRKSDNTRRRVGHSGTETGEALAALETPSQIAAFAVKAGIRAEEIERRAKDAPNFGQLRMVVGNRIRAIEARLEQFGGNREAAAYPKEAKRAAKAAAKVTKTVTKTVKRAKAVAGRNA